MALRISPVNAAAVWNVVYIENQRIALDTLGVANRSPAPTSDHLLRWAPTTRPPPFPGEADGIGGNRGWLEYPDLQVIE